MRFSTAVLLVVFIFALIMFVKALCILCCRSQALQPIAIFIYNIFDIPYEAINMFNTYLRNKANGLNFTLKGTASGAYEAARSRATAAYNYFNNRARSSSSAQPTLPE